MEDELPAKRKLRKYINDYSEKIEIVNEFESVDEVIECFESIQEIDLIFSDIELRDGNVFEAYKRLEIKIPIIFITAYNNFWMNAFETSGIEYLLKPYPFDRFKKAVDKYVRLKKAMIKEEDKSVLEKLEKYFDKKTNTVKTAYQDKIAIKTTQYTYFLRIEEIVYFQADHGIVLAFDEKNKRHVLSQSSLKQVEEMLNPNIFFKINRSEILNKDYIDRLSRYNKNILAINVVNSDIVLKTSQNKTAEFNNWLGI
ncbi:LytR/AlgR family response regulator transcription factor [Tenacibaculum sp. MAR_2009_124]|uniref:LytR/AlgR family response regulator transcription factor n=1 Tax=Tenacibaculum sp. MAR_2009_124 TaxID=1250059 RepID=UPI0015A399CE|nr:LytTR family DNA-binding domain-containing protein [Tenacibaculum sp. MAR_2009_124]